MFICIAWRLKGYGDTWSLRPAMNMKNHIQNTNTISKYAICSSSIDLGILFAQAPFISQGKRPLSFVLSVHYKVRRHAISKFSRIPDSTPCIPTPPHPIPA